MGITRAQERLYLNACERRLWGSREPAIRSQFLTEIPEELLTSKSLQIVFLAISQLAFHKSGVEAVKTRLIAS